MNLLINVRKMKLKKNNNMGFIPVKKITPLLFLVSALLFSTSFAGRVRKPMMSKAVSIAHEEIEMWEALRHGESDIHERVLKVKTNDYGRYDPTPALVKPPFKLIPN